jgi:hypothetical protein
VTGGSDAGDSSSSTISTLGLGTVVFLTL